MQVIGDGRRAGFVPVLVEVLADRDDLVLDRVGGAARAAVRATGPGQQPCLALREVTPDQGDHPPPAHPVIAGDLALGTPLDQHRRDHQLLHAHRSPLGLQV
jgi:hypothetical protein